VGSAYGQHEIGADPCERLLFGGDASLDEPCRGGIIGHEVVGNVLQRQRQDAAVGVFLHDAEVAPALAARLALGAGGSATGARIRRLLRTSAPLGRPCAAGTAALAVVVAFPFLALSGPALTLIGSHCIDTVSSGIPFGAGVSPRPW
jgi:hypothetical protein